MENQTHENNKESLQVRRKYGQVFPLLIIILLMVGSFWTGLEKGRHPDASSDASSAVESVLSPQCAIIDHKNNNTSIDFNLFWKSWDLLKNKYVDKSKLDANEMMYGAIKGMLASTDDPYTTFFDPKENKEFQEEITGSFQGIGAEIGMKDSVLTIVAPLDDSPAQKSGLQAGDKVLKINEASTMDMGLEKAISLIRGEKGTEVKLTIFRNGGEDKTEEITVKRDIITVKSVKVEFKDDNIALIKVSRFGDDTTDAFKHAIADVVTKKSRGLIIDLRNNPGGYLDAAVSMASLMLPENNVVVIEENGSGNQKKMYSKGGDQVSNLETVVLINEGSASASEILSGALRDNRTNNVTLVGKKSYGKGSVQELVSMTKDTAIKITVAKWLTPNGKQINHEGIAPDVEVSISADDRKQNKDPQFDKALEVLKEKLK
jgi:carboxyl-terminal processing protease